jgi:hypothetical protein
MGICSIKKDLQCELDGFEDIFFPLIIEYKISPPTIIDDICLAKIASNYTKKGYKD